MKKALNVIQGTQIIYLKTGILMTKSVLPIREVWNCLLSSAHVLLYSEQKRANIIKRLLHVRKVLFSSFHEARV